jgi:methylenetetrahydrofolate reductase (NADPH)
VSRLVAAGLVQGVHFCTLNLEKSVRTILENIGWTQGVSPIQKHNQLIGDERQDLTIEPGNASQLAEWGMHQAQSPVPKRGAVGGGQSAEDSWDEYPNGRFTDVRSPAYGEIDGWGSGLKTTVSPSDLTLTILMIATSSFGRMGYTHRSGRSSKTIRRIPRFRSEITHHTIL